MNIHIQQHQKLAMSIKERAKAPQAASTKERAILKEKSVKNNNQNQSASVNFQGRFFNMDKAAERKFYTSKPVKQLAKLSTDPNLLEAVAAIGFAGILRPLTILSVKGDKRDKEYAAGHSVSTAACGYLSTIALLGPINSAADKMLNKMKNDDKYLKGINRGKNDQSAFKTTAKMGSKFVLFPLVSAATIAGIPFIMKTLFPKAQKAKDAKKQAQASQNQNIQNLQANNTARVQEMNEPKVHFEKSEKTNKIFQKFTGKQTSFSGGKSLSELASKAWSDSKGKSYINRAQDYLGVYVEPVLKSAFEAKPVQKFINYIGADAKIKPSNEKITNHIDKKIEQYKKNFKRIEGKDPTTEEITKEKEKIKKNYIDNHNAKKNDRLTKSFLLGTAALGTAVYTNRTMKSKNIEPERKRTLVANQSITFALSSAGALLLDSVVFSQFGKLADKYKKYATEEVEEKHKKGELGTKEQLERFVKNNDKMKGKSIDSKEVKEAFKDNVIHKIKNKKARGLARTAPSLIAFTLMYRYLTPVVATPLADFWKNNIAKSPTKVKEKYNNYSGNYRGHLSSFDRIAKAEKSQSNKKAEVA